MAYDAQSIPGLRGRVIASSDSDYEVARRVFNGMIDRRPIFIVQPVDARDVAIAIAHATEHELPIAVRGGGHSVAGHSMVDGGLVIDNSQLRRVVVDRPAGIADVEAGATWHDFDQATQRFGLATTGGLVSSTGVAGFTLGGGIGWLLRRHGLACDNLVEADVVTSDGRFVKAAEDADRDLLWALRGGGGNFGVVTRFRFRLYPLSKVVGGLVAFSRSQARAVLRNWRDFIRSAPNDLTSVAALLSTPDGSPAVGVAMCHSGALVQAESAANTVRRFGASPLDDLGRMPYAQLQGMLDPTAPYGARNYWRSGFMSELADGAIDAIVEAADGMPSRLSQIHVHHLGGAMSREPSGGAAFAHRSANFVFNVIGTWTEAGQDSANMQWAKSAYEALGSYSTGAAYLNFLGADGPEREVAAFGGSLARLATLKRVYDPDNVFRQNHNVVPA